MSKKLLLNSWLHPFGTQKKVAKPAWTFRFVIVLDNKFIWCISQATPSNYTNRPFSPVWKWAPNDRPVSCDVQKHQSWLLNFGEKVVAGLVGRFSLVVCWLSQKNNLIVTPFMKLANLDLRDVFSSLLCSLWLLWLILTSNKTWISQYHRVLSPFKMLISLKIH